MRMTEKKDRLSVWLLRSGEPLPSDGGEPRLLRMGLIAGELSRKAGVIWWCSSFDHSKKEFRVGANTDIEICESLRLKMLYACGYKKNLSIRRIIHYKIEAHKFLKLAEQETEPDIIVAAMPPIEYAHAAVKYAKKRGIPVIIDVRDRWPELYEEYFNGIKRLVRIAITPFKEQLAWTLKHATGIFATSELFLEWALGYAGRPRNIFDRYYFVSYPDPNITIQEQDTQKWYQAGIEEDDFICCFFGEFGYAVDLETVLETAVLIEQEVPKVKFVICGTGQKMESYKKITRSIGNVIYPGWVDRRQICALGKIADAGLLAYKPSKNYECSFPNKFGEYLALGLPLLIRPKGVMQGLAMEHHCGLSYNDPTSLCDAIVYLSNHPEETEQMKLNSRALYEESFRADVVYRDMANYVLDIAKSFRGDEE